MRPDEADGLVDLARGELRLTLPKHIDQSWQRRHHQRHGIARGRLGTA